MNDIPKYGTMEWKAYQYEQAKKAKRGHNYQYWSDKHVEMLENGWELYVFSHKVGEKHATRSEISAKEIVEKLRNEGNYARIVAGYSKNRQGVKMFTIIYKKK